VEEISEKVSLLGKVVLIQSKKSNQDSVVLIGKHRFLLFQEKKVIANFHLYDLVSIRGTEKNQALPFRFIIFTILPTKVFLSFSFPMQLILEFKGKKQNFSFQLENSRLVNEISKKLQEKFRRISIGFPSDECPKVELPPAM
jgi:hypothetical protein